MAKIEIDVTKLVNEAIEGATEEAKEMVYARLVYEIVKNETDGLDAVDKDFIKHCVGIYGLNALLKAKLLERCGVVSGRRLYALLDWKG